MAFIPVPNTVAVEIRMGLDGQRVENTLAFEYAVTPTEADANTLGDALIDWWDNQYSANLCSSLGLVEVVLTDLTADDSFSVTRVPTTPVTGKQNLEPVPNSVAICISLRSSGRGRSSRGRNYIPAIPHDSVALNRVTGSVLTQLTSAYNTLGTLADDAGATWVVISRSHNKIPRTTGVTFPITTVVFTDNVVDSQRRRLPGRGT